jgi:hypothetical protein
MKRPSPLAIALGSCVLLVIGGIAGIAVGYVMVARTLNVFDQVPAIVSGGIGGIALVITGCVLAYVQVGRACAERERAQGEQTLTRIGALAEIERRRITSGEAAVPKPRTRRAAAKQGTA